MDELRTFIPRNEAVKLICDNLHYLQREEAVPLQDAAFRVASRDILSRIDLPDTKCSRWDGIAFGYDRYAAAGGDVSVWEENTDYIFSNTGIAIFRDEFDTMVKIEDTVFESGKLLKIIQPDVEKGQNIIPVGERMSTGEVLVARDTRIMPSHLNLMASGGNAIVLVYAKPRVAILATGNELVSNHDFVEAGKTIESNSFSMAAKVKARGGEAFIYPIIPDDPAAIKAGIKEAASSFDMIVLGGGFRERAARPASGIPERYRHPVFFRRRARTRETHVLRGSGSDACDRPGRSSGRRGRSHLTSTYCRLWTDA